MSNREIVRTIVLSLACFAVLILLGFGPLWIPQEGVWAASAKSSSAMPIGESKPASTMAPFELKRPDYGALEFVQQHFKR